MNADTISEVVDIVRLFKRPVDAIDVGLALGLSQRAVELALIIAAMDGKISLRSDYLYVINEPCAAT